MRSRDIQRSTSNDGCSCCGSMRELVKLELDVAEAHLCQECIEMAHQIADPGYDEIE